MNKNEKAVAETLGIELRDNPDFLPIMEWPDGFEAEISIDDGDDDGDPLDVYFGPLLKGDGTSHDEETENRRYADFLRAVQKRAAALGRGVRLEFQLRSKQAHILDHLGFTVAQDTIDDDEFWGEQFDDASYEWRPE